MYITLYFIVTRLPDTLHAVKDHFLALDPTDLTLHLLEQQLLAAETSVVAVGAALGTLRKPFFEGCSPSPLAPSYASAAAVDILGTEDVGTASSLSGKRRSSNGKGGKGGGDGSGGGGDGSGGGGGGGSGGGGGGGGGGSGGSGGGSGGFGGSSGGSGGGGGGSGGGNGSGGGGSGGSRVDIFVLDYDAILAAMYALSVSAEGDCYLCVPPNPGIEDAALGASESTLPGSSLAEALHTFTLDSVLACSSTVLPCPAVPFGSPSDLHLPSFSTNLTLLWHRRLGHPSLPRLCGMHSRLLVSGLPRSLPPLPPSPALPCLPCVEGWHRATPHSSFPPTTAPMQTIHMDVWGPARINGQDRKCYFLLVVDDYKLRLHKGEVPYVLIPWIHLVCLQLRDRFRKDLPVLRLHSDRGGEFSSNLLRDFFHGEGILQRNGIVERHIGLVMEVAHTSMIHAAAPHFLWSFAVCYAAHQLNLWPHVSLPETSPTLCWTGKVGDASVFRDVTFDELVPFYRLFPYRTAPPPPPPPPLLFLAPGPLPVDPVPPQGPTPSGVSQVEPLPRTVPVEIAVDSSAAGGAASRGAASGGAASEVLSLRVRSLGLLSLRVRSLGGIESEGAEIGGAEPRGTASAGGPAGASPRLSPGREPLLPQQLRKWFAQCTRLRSGAAGGGGSAAGGTGAGGVRATSFGGAGVTAGTGGTGGAQAADPRGARTRGIGDDGAGGVGGAGAGDPRAGDPGSGGTGAEGAGAGARDPGAGGAGAGGTGIGGGGSGGTGARDPGAGGAVAGGAGASGTSAGGTLQRRLFFVPPPPSSLPPPELVLCQVLNSPLPAPSPYAEQTDSFAEIREPESRPALPVRAVCTGHRVPRPCPPPVPVTRVMALRPSSVPLRVPLLSPPASSLPGVLDPDPLLRLPEHCELVDFAAAYCLNYATSLVAESKPKYPLSVGGECALSTNILEDTQEYFDCLALTDPDAPDIPTPRSYAEAIEGPYSSHWQTTMDAQMESWKSTGTYVDAVPPTGANIVDGICIFKVKQPPGSLPIFKARYRDYELHSLDFSTTFLQGSLHEEIWLRRPPDFTGSFPAGTQWSLRRPVYKWHDTPRITLAAFGFAPSTTDPSVFLRTDTSLPMFYVPVYVDDLVFAVADTEALALVKSELQKRHTYTDLGELTSYLRLQITRDRARCTITMTLLHMVHQVLQHFGFRFSSPQSTPLPTGHSFSAPASDEFVEPSGQYPELVGCLRYLMTCTKPDLAYPLSILARYVAPGRHRPEHWEAVKRVLRYLCSTSGMGLVPGGQGLVGYTFRLGSGSVSRRSTRSSSVLGSSCEAEIYAGAMVAQELRWLAYLLTDLDERPRSSPVLTKRIALRYFLAREMQEHGQLRLSYMASRANTADIFTKALQSGDHQRFCTVLGLVPTLPHLLTA
ncbi:unnamed protein product [Closterium sp. NIES-53]